MRPPLQAHTPKGVRVQGLGIWFLGGHHWIPLVTRRPNMPSHVRFDPETSAQPPGQGPSCACAALGVEAGLSPMWPKPPPKWQAAAETV